VNQGTLIGWMGMRGAVSLAVALGVPTVTDAGRFAERPAILAVVFGVVLITLVVQGLTVGPAVRLLRISRDDDSADESRARVRAAEAALEHLRELEAQDWTRNDSVERLRALFEYRRGRFSAQLRDDGDGRYEDMTSAWLQMQCRLIEAQRDAVEALRRDGEVSDDVARRVVRDLDLEEARLLLS
jgi:monovalent cation/hydrogen antiporter